MTPPQAAGYLKSQRTGDKVRPKGWGI